jgi:hypothetical protein
MTLLGMMTGATLPDTGEGVIETVVYTSIYGESPALEKFLESFPLPSPTLFQTSIHPSGVQQVLIGRGRPVREFFPFTGDGELPVQGAFAALAAPAATTWWCGGDERGSWLREHGAASERSYAFTLGLAKTRTAASVGALRLEPTSESGRLPLPDWFGLLHGRRNWDGIAGVGWRLTLEWF